MNDRRIELQSRFEKIDGLAFDKILNSAAVYFQPGPTVSMVYPCIVYKREGAKLTQADDYTYHIRARYSGVVIDPNPDSEIIDTILWSFQMISPDRIYSAENLYHYPFTLYF